MVKPTPWAQNTGADPAGAVSTTVASAPSSTATTGRTTSGERAERRLRRRAMAAALLRRTRDRAETIRTSPALSGKWGYVFAALGGIVTFILLFQHWMVAHGPDGVAAATPFGQIDSTTRYLTVWSSQGPTPTANLTGSWAVTASAAMAVTVAAVVIYILTDSPRFARIATGTSVLTAVLVVANLLYLTARQKELKTMTNRRWDLGGQVGSWLNWAFNDGTKPVAGLNEVDYVATSTVTASAIAAVIIAAAAAVMAVATMPRSPEGSTWIPWRISVSRATTANYVATGSERTPEAAAAPAPDVPDTGPQVESRTAEPGPPDSGDRPADGPESPPR